MSEPTATQLYNAVKKKRYDKNPDNRILTIPEINAVLEARAAHVGEGIAQSNPILFRYEDFTAHSGDRLHWKIDCDALTPADWACLAAMAARRLPPFGVVEGIVRGGAPFAEALAAHLTPGAGLLIADDVCTTGASMEAHRAGRDALGVVAFARGSAPPWVIPLFRAFDPGAAPVDMTKAFCEWLVAIGYGFDLTSAPPLPIFLRRPLAEAWWRKEKADHINPRCAVEDTYRVLSEECGWASEP